MLPSYRPNVPLAPYTTFAVGGSAQYLLEAHTTQELERGVSEAHAALLPLTILGSGSNVLVSDTGVDGCVIVNKTKGTTFVLQDDRVMATVASGEILDEFVALCASHGYWGIENLSHIPGTVGATPIQNVGAYGVEVSALIQSVQALNVRTGEEKVFSNEACGFGYRSSYFKTVVGRDWIIVSVTFALSTTPRPHIGYADLGQHFADTAIPSIGAIREAVIAIRSRKFPNWQEVGTAGSFFKNPVISTEQYNELKKDYPDVPGYQVDEENVKVPLGWVLDKVCHLKGYSDGLVGCYSEQALVLVAQRGATATQVSTFANMIIEKVFEKTRIMIECEVTRI